jgi:hypothetical protein
LPPGVWTAVVKQLAANRAVEEGRGVDVDVVALRVLKMALSRFSSRSV